MDCSTFIFSHNDLRFINIIVNKDRITILDWELARYYPLVWVRTKFAIYRTLYIERVGNVGIKVNGEYKI